MKKIIFTLLLSIMLLLSFTGCDSNENQSAEKDGNLLECVYEKGSLKEYVDTETGVHYFLIKSDGSFGFAFSPRYDENGNIYIDKEDTK